MVFTEVDDFIKELIKLKKVFLSKAQIDIVYKRIDKVSLRIEISPIIYIDVYYNNTSRRFDFSLIKDNKRVFGFDNLKSWHYHPIENSDDHIECDEPSLQYIFSETVEKVCRFQ